MVDNGQEAVLNSIYTFIFLRQHSLHICSMDEKKNIECLNFVTSDYLYSIFEKKRLGLFQKLSAPMGGGNKKLSVGWGKQ